MIKQAPISFIVAFLLAFLLAFLAVRWMYSERLQAKDDMLSYYREKMGLEPGDKTRYSGKRNSELKAEVLSVVAKLRDLTKHHKQNSDAISERMMRESMAAKTEEEKQRAWDKGTRDMTISGTQFTSAYDHQYKIDAILLHDEMRGRLPKGVIDEIEKGPFGTAAFEFAVNPLNVGFIADKLERMAKALPNT